ncbi:hypothetical protein WJX77_010980 [Trebouxia sp. C0004]
MAAAASVQGQTLSAFMWGAVSDRVGRKPVLMVGNMSACLSVSALGLAPDYPAAVASRFVGGLFTAASGVALKSIIAESYGPVGQAKVIGYTTAGYSIGAIAGPIIGGAWLLDRPFLLPCLVSACMSGLAFLEQPVPYAQQPSFELQEETADKGESVPFSNQVDGEHPVKKRTGRIRSTIWKIMHSVVT